jgi:protein SCO1/2
MNTRTYALIMSGLSGLGLALIATIYVVRGSDDGPATAQAIRPETLPVLGELSNFTLTNAQGRPFAVNDLRGKVWVADFIFTSCAGICPVMTGNLRDVQEAYAGNDEVAFVSISVDPATDTPEVLADYARKYSAPEERWQFLTGDLDEIHRIALEEFHLGSVEDPIIHSPHFVLVDRSGRIRAYYTGTEATELPRLREGIEELLREPVGTAPRES